MEDTEERKPKIRGLAGQTKERDIWSVSSTAMYTLDVDSEGDEAKVSCPNGGCEHVDIADSDSTDFGSISCTDHETGMWELAVTDPPPEKD